MYFSVTFIGAYFACLIFSAITWNRNLINTSFERILRTDGKFEDERFINKRNQQRKNVEAAEIKINILKLNEKVTEENGLVEEIENDDYTKILHDSINKNLS